MFNVATWASVPLCWQRSRPPNDTDLPLASPGPAPQASAHFTRIERVLDYIHGHLDQPLSLEQLAEQSCWSRWQLQRVFLHETGLTAAHYVRELAEPGGGGAAF